MNQDAAYALLAADSYRDARRSSANFAPIDPAWTELKDYAISGSGEGALLVGAGFSARVYRGPGGEVVISYAGTQFGGSGIGQTGDWLSGNMPLAVGLYAKQAIAAAELYQKVRANEGLNITFTGHSLGGGLAAMMAVCFDRPAKVFAPAPFGKSVDTTQYSRFPFGLLPGVLNPIRVKLLANSLANPQLGPVPPALLDYTPLTDYTSRAANVKAWAVKGEVLEKTLFAFPFIESSGTRTSLFTDSATQLDFLSKHSIDLHAAGLLSTSFNEWAAKLPNALPLMFDRNFYAVDLIEGRSQDFLVKVVRNEVGVAGITPNGMLTHFANDLQKLGTNISGLNAAAQNAMIAQGIEWYYWQGTNYAGQEFFTKTGELLQYTTAQGDGLTDAQNKASLYTTGWLAALQNANGAAYSATIKVNYDQWNISTGSSGVTATAKDDSKSQVSAGGAGGDTFTGGNKADTFLAGAGDDTLDGKAGNDVLYGGADNDTYNFTDAFGKDTIIDSDGLGQIKIGGKEVGTAKGAGKRGVWVADLGGGDFASMAVYDDQSSSTGKTLVIINDANADNTITVKNFNQTAAEQGGYLGIKLDPTQSIAIVQGTGTSVGASAANVWADKNFNSASLNGKSSTINEGNAKSFNIYLAQGAKAGAQGRRRVSLKSRATRYQTRSSLRMFSEGCIPIWHIKCGALRVSNASVGRVIMNCEMCA